MRLADLKLFQDYMATLSRTELKFKYEPGPYMHGIAMVVC